MITTRQPAARASPTHGASGSVVSTARVWRSESVARAGSSGAEVASRPRTSESLGDQRTTTLSTWVRSSAASALVAATSSTISCVRRANCSASGGTPPVSQPGASNMSIA